MAELYQPAHKEIKDSVGKTRTCDRSVTLPLRLARRTTRLTPASSIPGSLHPARARAVDALRLRGLHSASEVPGDYLKLFLAPTALNCNTLDAITLRRVVLRSVPGPGLELQVLEPVVVLVVVLVVHDMPIRGHFARLLPPH